MRVIITPDHLEIEGEWGVLQRMDLVTVNAEAFGSFEDQIFLKAISQASTVLSKSFWVCAKERNQASNWEGGR